MTPPTNTVFQCRWCYALTYHSSLTAHMILDPEALVARLRKSIAAWLSAWGCREGNWTTDRCELFAVVHITILLWLLAE
jgi:hypothetical protein